MHQSIEAAKHFQYLLVRVESKKPCHLLLGTSAVAVGILMKKKKKKKKGANIGNASFAAHNVSISLDKCHFIHN